MAAGELKFGEVVRPTLVSKNLISVPVGNGNNIGRPEEISFLTRTTAKYKVFVSTWNVGGVPPPNDGLNLEDWLGINDQLYDIYVLGFQEIVPLSAWNVLGPENSKISARWKQLIGTALNKSGTSSLVEKHKVQPLVSDDDCCVDDSSERYVCITDKQMVGILVSVWVRSGLSEHVSCVSVSRVGCGVMGYLANKGSVSVRFCLHQTSFCFVCCHLASGGKIGDEKHRNSNAVGIFSRTHFASEPSLDLPKKILHHDRVVLLGDLNYRISLPDAKILSLVKQKEWSELLEKDQLRREFSEGRVFEGWNEGMMAFSPTYKYFRDSDQYQGLVPGKRRGKLRAPAWCDRILWFGEGMKQNRYERCELKLSDHRPVRAVFTAEVEVLGYLKPFGGSFMSQM